jgi:flavin reductase (DIM6/NTAB) family NADH-FMN oxidoreductase RutF
MHHAIEPAIHYWGTPVVLVSTLNEDGSTNLAPMSSAWWLGWSCMLGLDASSQTSGNLRRSGQCVLNLPSAGMAQAVNRLALTTGSNPVPVHKKLLGYRQEADKFRLAGLTPQASVVVAPSRALECPVQLEAVLEDIRPFARGDVRMGVPAVCVEVRIVKVHVHPDLLMEGHTHRIEPDRWHPLLMSFREFYGRGARLEKSRLGRGPEEAYAPWRQTGWKGLAGKTVAAWSRHKYGGPEVWGPEKEQAPGN